MTNGVSTVERKRHLNDVRGVTLCIFVTRHVRRKLGLYTSVIVEEICLRSVQSVDAQWDTAL